MRNLEPCDMFAGIRLLKKYNLKDEARKIAANSDTIGDAWAQGYEMVWSLFDRLTEAGGEHDLYELLSGPFEMTADEIRHMKLADMLANIKQLAEENDLVDFFRRAAALMR